MAMQNRFATKKRDIGAIRDIVLPVLIFVALVSLFYMGLGSVGQTSESERLRAIEQAVTRATVQCYAVEGVYPPSIDYLEQNYGLIIDHEKYIVQYDAFASNLMPTIMVLPMNFDDGAPGGFDDEDAL